MTLHKLPLEALSQIHCQVLNDLDITTVPAFYGPDPELEAAELRKLWLPAKSFVLDPAILSMIRYYDRLFLTSSKHKPPIWEQHVRFVFPSALHMSDVLTVYHATGRLDRIRKVKIFEKGFVGRSPMWDDRVHVLCWNSRTILEVFQDLKLDHLEWDYSHPILHNSSSQPGLAVWDGLIELFASPCWKQLTVLVPNHSFDQQGLDLLVEQFKQVARNDRTDKYLFDLPCTPTIKNASGRIIGLDTDKRPADVKQRFTDSKYQGYYPELADPYTYPIPSWLGGEAVCTEIVLRRERYGICGPHSSRRDEINLMREWIAGNGQTWKMLREDIALQWG